VENIWLNIVKNNKKFLIGGIYRHTGHGLVEFSNAMEQCLSRISSSSYPCIIAGDINIDLSKCDVNTTTAEYVSNMLLNNFYPAVIMPTRITSRSLLPHLYV